MIYLKCILVFLVTLFVGPVLAIIGLIFIKPDLANMLFSRSDHDINFLKTSFQSALSVDSSLSLPTKKSNYTRFCVLPREINPRDFAARITDRNLSIIESNGGLMGWNDNNWHIILFNDKEAAIVTMESFLFPFNGDATCSNQIFLEFDRVKKHVMIKSAKEQ